MCMHIVHTGIAICATVGVTCRCTTRTLTTDKTKNTCHSECNNKTNMSIESLKSKWITWKAQAAAGARLILDAAPLQRLSQGVMQIHRLHHLDPIEQTIQTLPRTHTNGTLPYMSLQLPSSDYSRKNQCKTNWSKTTLVCLHRCTCICKMPTASTQFKKA